LDVGNAGNDGWDKDGDPVVRVRETGGDRYSYKEEKSGRGQTAQRADTVNSRSHTGDHLVTQNDLVNTGFLQATEACHFLSIAAGPQNAKKEYLTISKVKNLVTEFQDDGSLRDDFQVIQPSKILTEIARALGYSRGSVGYMTDTLPSDADAIIRRRDPSPHSNLGGPDGSFVWESWDGASEDHIPSPSFYYGLYFK